MGLSISRRLALVAGIGLCAGAAAVVACVSFVPQLLDDRKGTLLATPANSFAYEMAHLLVPADTLKADEGQPYGEAERRTRDRARDNAGLDAAQVKLLDAMRAQADGDAAYEAGAGLPPAVRLYTAGAQDYRAATGGNDHTDEVRARARDRAVQRFQQVLALPGPEAAPRAVWAAYMLGRMQTGQIGVAGVTGVTGVTSIKGADMARQRQQAALYFERARSLAQGGAPDPWALAVASFGEQARTWLVADGQQCNWVDFDSGSACADGVPLAAVRQAVGLYAQQAARGSASAVDSLRLIAAWGLRDAQRAADLAADPLAQQVLVAYGLARLGDITDGDAASASDYFARGMLVQGYGDSARGEGNVTPNPALVNLVNALRQARGQVSGADRVAALAYRTGRYELAEALAGKQDSALAAWVRAKLALRRGDAEAAARAYGQAARAFPAMDASVEPERRRLLVGESAVLHLSRAQYVEALAQLRMAALDAAKDQGQVWSSDAFPNYASDAFYVAERVLGVDELKAYVDAQVPGSPVPSDVAVEARMKEQRAKQQLPQNQAGRSASVPKPVPDYPDARSYAARSLATPTFDDDLRQLLARRLVRADRIDEALPYFPDDADERFAVIKYTNEQRTEADIWHLRASARQYGQALSRARQGWRATTRARGWYEAAVLARWRGMEIMGYEQAPDYHIYDGDIECCSGPDAGVAGALASKLTPQQRAQATLPGPYVSDDERHRYAASLVPPMQRYHYRTLAVDYIGRAADALPARSQAFAAVLCQGAGMVFYDEAASRLYQRYVEQGAWVPFAVNFGRACAAPDFSAAGRFVYVQAWHQARAWVSQHRLVAAAALLLVVLATAAGVSAWRRRRRHHAHRSDSSDSNDSGSTV